MRIANLIEDTKGTSGCLYEHGLSFYIETEHHKLLLDTGATDAFIKNAESKGIKLAEVDTVIISHGHYDHAGGVLAFAKLNPNATVYIHKNAIGEFYNLKNGQTKYIGMDRAIASLSQVVFIGKNEFSNGNIAIDNEIAIFTDVKGRKLWPCGNKILKRKCGDDFVQDSFDHEQYLVITEGDKRVLLSGCAHNGILNILDTYRDIYSCEPTHVISGFHTVQQLYTDEDDAIVEQTAMELVKTDIAFYSGHCTGDRSMQILKRIMGEQLTEFHSGDEIL